jgi:hypothetical protein
MVMAFNNVFVVMAVAFACLLPLVMLTRQAPPAAPGGH